MNEYWDSIFAFERKTINIKFKLVHKNQTIMEVIGTAIALGDVAVKLAMFGAAIKNAPQVWYEYSAALHNIVNVGYHFHNRYFRS